MVLTWPTLSALHPSHAGVSEVHSAEKVQYSTLDSWGC